MVASGALGFDYHDVNGGDASLEALYSRAGPGAELSLHAPRHQRRNGVFRGLSRALSADGRSRRRPSLASTRAQLRHVQRLAPGLWAKPHCASDALRCGRRRRPGRQRRLRRASLRYIQDYLGWSLGLSYDVTGEYLFDSQPLLGGSFMPLGLRNREVHALSASASAPLGPDFWFDAYGGWAIDRYGRNGPLGGLSLRYTPAEGFDISAGISHSTVSSHQGENHPVTTAGINILYKLQDEVPSE